MKMAIIGAGAIGSVAAAYLTKAGVDTTLIGREDQVAAIRKNGLHVKGTRGEENIMVKIHSCVEEEYGLVIFTTKTQDIEQAYTACQSFLSNSIIMTAQNGVRADLILQKYVDDDFLLSSIVMFGATYVQPGEVTFNFEGDWIIGKPFRPVGPKVEATAETLKKAFPVVVSEDIRGMKRLKLFVNFNNCIPALIGKSMQETFADIDLCRLSILLLNEGVAIVKKADKALVSLPQFPADRIYDLINMPIDRAASIIQKTLTGLSKEPLYGSILQSIMRGRQSEIDFINGEIVRLAKELRVKAPLNEKMVGLVHKVEGNKKFFQLEEIKKEFQL